jgi:K(+)-stimulated pyrophosphate-energized sodium pump
MSTGIIIAIVCALIGIAYGVISIFSILSKSRGNDEMIRISNAIQEGAVAYLSRQYKAIGMVGIVLFIAVWFALGDYTAIGFAIGAILSGLTGYIGMNVSVRANSRTAEAAREGINPALQIAFKGGAITGMLVVGLALLGVAGYYAILVSIGLELKTILHALVGLAFGGSLISIL